MNDVLQLENAVRYVPAAVQFPQYEILKEYAATLADHIRQVEVTEDNIKDVKKDLAQVRKIVTELNDRRKTVKKEILKEYTEFESQIKEIDNIISSAENEVRNQTRILEDAERERKKDDIRQIWDSRIDMYRIGNYQKDWFDIWLKPAHLNKTTTMKSIETDIVDWLEQTEKDIETISAMETDGLLEEYLDCLDLSQAIQNVKRRKTYTQYIEEPEEVSAWFVVTGAKDIKLTEALLKENKINYRRNK